MDKLRLLEDRLKEKVDVKAFEELEGKVQKLQESINHRVEELKERIVENETKVEHSGVNDDKGNSGGSDSEEQNEIGTRRNNMIIYRAQDIDSESAEDRESGDALFVHELCNDLLQFPLQSGDIERMFRLGRREEGRERPLLVRFSSEEREKSIMSRVKELKMARRDSGELA